MIVFDILEDLSRREHGYSWTIESFAEGKNAPLASQSADLDPCIATHTCLSADSQAVKRGFWPSIYRLPLE